MLISVSKAHKKNTKYPCLYKTFHIKLGEAYTSGLNISKYIHKISHYNTLEKKYTTFNTNANMYNVFCQITTAVFYILSKFNSATSHNYIKAKEREYKENRNVGGKRPTMQFVHKCVCIKTYS